MSEGLLWLAAVLAGMLGWRLWQKAKRLLASAELRMTVTELEGRAHRHPGLTSEIFTLHEDVMGLVTRLDTFDSGVAEKLAEHTTLGGMDAHGHDHAGMGLTHVHDFEFRSMQGDKAVEVCVASGCTAKLKFQPVK